MTGDSGSSGGSARPDATVPHSARVWNYWLGGKDNYPVDREAGEHICTVLPSIVDIARADRAFLIRAVRYLVGEAGVRQFLDIGTGLPTANNTHEVAQSIAPECRIVYVDNDPLVLVHARALLTSSPEGATDYIDADLRDPETIVQQASRVLDFDKPIALMLLGVLNHIMDTDQAYPIVDRLMERLSSGSYLVVAHPTADIDGEAMVRAMQWMNDQGGTPVTARNHQEISRFFQHTQLLDPGVVSLPRWRPDALDIGSEKEVSEYCGIGRVP